jgi:hypothetical protein
MIPGFLNLRETRLSKESNLAKILILQLYLLLLQKMGNILFIQMQATH